MVFVAFWLAMAPVASAQTADQILERYFKAAGGLDRLRALSSLRITGVMTLESGEDVHYVTEKARPNRMRMEIRSGGMTGVQAYDGKIAWSFLPQRGEKQATTVPDPQDVGLIAADADFDGPFIDWPRKAIKLERLEDDDFDGHPVFKLRMVKNTGRTEIFYVDRKTSQVIGSKIRDIVGRDMVYTTRTQSDFRVVGGLTFPFRVVERRSNTDKVRTIQISRIELNPPLDPSRFAFPGTAAPDAAKGTAPAPAKPARAAPDSTPAKP